MLEKKIGKVNHIIKMKIELLSLQYFTSILSK